MALTPVDETHALQIQAGTIGRKAGHDFEDAITLHISALKFPFSCSELNRPHVVIGHPAEVLLNYLCRFYGVTEIESAAAISTGTLATSEDGRKWLSINGVAVRRCKSDLVLTIRIKGREPLTIGISIKQCNNRKPTNAQLYFTTARGFARLLRGNGIPISDLAVEGLRQFCGDVGFRPLDDVVKLKDRIVDPRRFFWEEMTLLARAEWESVLANHQDEVTRLLLQKAYLEDPFVPNFLVHKTKAATSLDETEVAIYAIDELIQLSSHYQGFATKPYSVRKGRAVSNLKCNTPPLNFIIEHFLWRFKAETCARPRVEAEGYFFEVAA